MKKILFAALALLGIVYYSCKKEKDGPGELYGSWKLTQTLQDRGDGSGKYEPVKGQNKYLIIAKDGTFSGEAMPELSTFKILDSVKLEVSFKGQSKPLTYAYKVTARSLVLNPPCFEGCGFKFVRK